MEKALSHIRLTGTFPVSLLALDSPTLSHRHDHGYQPGGPSSLFGTAAAPLPSTHRGVISRPRALSRRGGTRTTALSPSPPSLSSSHTPLISSPLSSPPTSPNDEQDQVPDQDQKLTNSPRAFPLVPPQKQKQPEVDSKEDQNTVGECPVTPAQIAAAKQKVDSWLQPGQPGSLIFPPLSSPTDEHHPHQEQASQKRSGLRICLLDGFLLYSPAHLPSILPALDVKLFLLVSREKATERREARDGYVTLEGFWTDPPGYVEKIVWPNYVDAHRWLFRDGDPERGMLDEEAMRKYGVSAQVGKGLDVPFGETLDWAIETILRGLEGISPKE